VSWHPRIDNASAAERKNWQLIGEIALHTASLPALGDRDADAILGYD